jgi:hypothetical protein
VTQPTEHDGYQGALALIAGVLRRHGADLGIVGTCDLQGAERILKRYATYIPGSAAQNDGGKTLADDQRTQADRDRLKNAIRERHAIVTTLLIEVNANLGAVEAAPWRLIRNCRLLVRCQRQQRGIDQLNAANSATLYQLTTGEELPHDQ